MPWYRRLTFMGFPKHRVGDDGSLWSYRMNRQQKYRWKRLKGRKHKTKKSKLVYIRAGLSHNGKTKLIMVHRLVLEAFVGPCPEGMECCHRNGNTQDNRKTNLRWDTPKGNAEDKRRHGTTGKGVSRNARASNGRAVYTEKDGAKVIRLRSSGVQLREIARRTKINYWIVIDMVKRRHWTTR